MRVLSATNSHSRYAAVPLGSSNPSAKRTALPLTSTMTAPSPSLPNSPMTDTYTRPSGPTATDSGFFNPAIIALVGACAARTAEPTQTRTIEHDQFFIPCLRSPLDLLHRG